VNNDILVGFIDSAGNARVIDTYSNSIGQPEYDSQQDVQDVKGSLINGELSISFSRAVNTGDSKQDVIIPQSNVVLTWAFGTDSPRFSQDNPSQTTFGYHGNGNDVRGGVSVNFFTGESQAVPEKIAPDVVLITIIAILLGIYMIIRYLGLIQKRIQSLINPNLGINAVGIKNESEENEIFQEKENPSGEFFYRGSVACIYQDKAITVKSHEEEERRRVSAPIRRYHKMKKEQGEALLSTKDAAVSSNYSSLTFLSMLANYRIPRMHFSALDLLIGVTFCAINLLFFAFLDSFPGLNAGLMWGYLASANSLLVALPATRNSILVWLLGIPFDKTIMYHRWLGRLVLLQATIHFGFYINSKAIDFAPNQWNYGIAAWSILLVIFITSIGWIRRHHFNYFFASHYIFIAYYVLGALHSPKSFKFLAYAALAFYLFDRIVRLFWGMFPTKAVKMELVSGAIRLTFRKHFAAKYKVGQYVFLNFPQIALLEWHPFTLASGPDEEHCEVLIKGLGDHTKYLISKIESCQELYVRVDGPYGKWPFDFARYKSIVLVSGGVGVTPSMTLIRHVFHLNRETKEVDPYLRDVFFIWSCKNEKEFQWFKEMLEEAMVRSASKNSVYPRLHAYVHIISADTDLSNLPSYIHSGRPDVSQIFSRVAQVGIERKYEDHRIAVVACGPSALVNQAWDESTSRSKGKSQV
jgi:predicted ferric reductase